jgi:hypothetical protein
VIWVRPQEEDEHVDYKMEPMRRIEHFDKVSAEYSVRYARANQEIQTLM